MTLLSFRVQLYLKWTIKKSNNCFKRKFYKFFLFLKSWIYQFSSFNSFFLSHWFQRLELSWFYTFVTCQVAYKFLSTQCLFDLNYLQALLTTKNLKVHRTPGRKVTLSIEIDKNHLNISPKKSNFYKVKQNCLNAQKDIVESQFFFFL